jgi:hypothetical protein
MGGKRIQGERKRKARCRERKVRTRIEGKKAEKGWVEVWAGRASHSLGAL